MTEPQKSKSRSAPKSAGKRKRSPLEQELAKARAKARHTARALRLAKKYILRRAAGRSSEQRRTALRAWERRA